MDGWASVYWLLRGGAGLAPSAASYEWLAFLVPSMRNWRRFPGQMLPHLRKVASLRDAKKAQEGQGCVAAEGDRVLVGWRIDSLLSLLTFLGEPQPP